MDDLDFGTNDENEEETKNEENSKSFVERLEAWKQAEIDELFLFHIPSVVKSFNQNFQAVLSKMTLENITS